MKDRAAILPIGRSQQSIYWYVPDGRFTTSRYYADTLPAWVQQFNARHLAQGYAGKSWALLLPASEYKEVDSVDLEGARQGFCFPAPAARGQHRPEPRSRHAVHGQHDGGARH